MALDREGGTGNVRNRETEGDGAVTTIGHRVSFEGYEYILASLRD